MKTIKTDLIEMFNKLNKAGKLDVVYHSWNDLPEEAKFIFNNCKDFQCGLSNKLFRLPSFCFIASCVAHDYSYRVGGGFKDWIRANNGFFTRMIKDIQMSEDPILNKAFYYLMAILYYISVTLFGWLPFIFHWGKKRTLKEILDLYMHKC